ncbi:4Fe-4S binding protein [Faecalimonas umbilicata]|nr:4Fe-4S binding protein [Faecalimonas umbilicata]
MDMELTEELKRILRCQGADLVGIGDMSKAENCNFKRGVAVAVALPPNVIIDLQEAPTKEYYNLYYSLNEKLNEIIMAGGEFLRNRGFEVYEQTTDRVKIDQNNISRLPHKTVATRAGLGWIGKNCLLVTPQYGAAIRISSFLTNAPLECNDPINQSRCGYCNLCVKKCPAQALKGTLWEVGIQREEIVDINKCYKKQVEIMLQKTGIETDLCGRCFAVCVYTQKYLKSIAADFKD